MTKKQDLPPLAHYQATKDYIPTYGDYIIWTGWLTTWHGVVTEFDGETGELSVIFSGIPYLLFTLTEHEMQKETRKLKLADIQAASHGTFAIQKHDYTRNATIWFI